MHKYDIPDIRKKKHFSTFWSSSILTTFATPESSWVDTWWRNLYICTICKYVFYQRVKIIIQNIEIYIYKHNGFCKWNVISISYSFIQRGFINCPCWYTGCSLNIVFFALRFFDFSELCQFCCTAGVLPAWCVYTHWHRGKTEKGQSPEYSKIFVKKHNI